MTKEEKVIAILRKIGWKQIANPEFNSENFGQPKVVWLRPDGPWQYFIPSINLDYVMKNMEFYVAYDEWARYSKILLEKVLGQPVTTDKINFNELFLVATAKEDYRIDAMIELWDLEKK